MNDYEEKSLKCVGCGKEVKRVVLKSREIKTFLCQWCAKNV